MTRPVVLFLCTGNAARSQMAEALLRHLAGDRFDIYSAGIEPRGIHPLAATTMAEIGIPLTGYRSKSVDEFLGKLTVKYAIILCERIEQECPHLWPFALQQLNWHFDDPVVKHGSTDQQLDAFRSVRDEIAARIGLWLSEKPV